MSDQEVIADSLSKERAEELVKKIKWYWINKGQNVTVWIEPIPRFFKAYQIRSDLINGAPRAKS
jgi:hypothetical protein